MEHIECPIQELAELRRKLIPGGRIVVGVKNEGVELWKNWKSNNRDNHLWTWNYMLLAGNTLRAAGFAVDAVYFDGTRTQVEQKIATTRFGSHGHTFQYIFGGGAKNRDVVVRENPRC